ncbi:MAG: MFS transporter [Acidobacteria bacterium]|nr:MFS transporter [Acidobacteriota bacterium]MCI0722774.1 MFS transporter [Acidobacteriota bacterium]
MGTEQHNRLYQASCVSLVVIAFTFAIRGDILGELSHVFHLNKEQLGWVAGAAFWGFTLSIFMGGQLCDQLGMGKLLGLAFVGHIAGVLLTIFATGFWHLWTGTLIIGLANGLVESAINPLIATVYPEQKTERLNTLHAWFPGGILLGGLLTFGLTQLNLHWQIKMAVILIPTLIYGLMLLGQKFPPTERVQHGVSTATMYKESLRPQFLVWVFCMLLTASTELGPNQWIPNILTTTAHLPGILVLAWINGIMTVGRLFAGPIVRLLSPITLLIVAAGLSAFGLFGLSWADSAVPTLVAATVFAIGICYFWPTMLGVTSERFPAGGALLLAIMGGAGNLSVALVLPLMGKIYDAKGPELALRYIVALPLTLLVIFGAIWLYDHSKGGYKVAKLASK